LWGRTKRGGRAIKDLVEDANGAIENGVRMSVYMHLRKAGVSRQKAAVAAKNLTVNFNRKGTAGPVINSFYLFANAGIQGAHLALRTLKSKRGRHVWAGLVATGALMALWNQLMGGEDDDGEAFINKLSDWERERNWILMIPPGVVEKMGAENIPFLKEVAGGGWYLKLPAAWVFNIPLVMGDVLVNVGGFGESTGSGAMRLLLAINNSVNPLGENSLGGMIAPTALDPAVAIWENMNYWAGPVYRPTTFPGDTTPESQQGFAGTGQIWKDMAETMNRVGGGDQWRSSKILDFHPESLRYWFNHFAGGAGAFINRVGENMGALLYGAEAPILSSIAGDEPFRLERAPFLRKVVGKTWDQVDSERYYTHREELTQLIAEMKSRKEATREGPDQRQLYRDFMRDNRELLGRGEWEKTRNQCVYSGGGLIADMKATDCRLKKLRQQRNLLREKEQTVKVKDRIRAIEDRILADQRRFNTRWNDLYLDRGWIREMMEE
jgi:hypothetical protein